MSDEQIVASFRSHVQKHDPDRYLLGLFSPRALREDLYVLFAFNYELAKVRETVSEPQLGEMRLQWWHDTLNAIYSGTVYRHDLVEALARLIETYRLPITLFISLIEARRNELYFHGWSDFSQLEDHADNTAGQLLRQQIALLTNDTKNVDAIARHAGIAWALVGYIRSFAYYLGENRVYLPQDLLPRSSYGNYRKAQADDTLRNAIEMMVNKAEDHIGRCQLVTSQCDKKVKSALLINSLTSSYIKTIRKAQFDPFHLNVEGDALFRYCKLYLKSLRY